jgi:hypothetical protein
LGEFEQFLAPFPLNDRAINTGCHHHPHE